MPFPSPTHILHPPPYSTTARLLHRHFRSPAGLSQLHCTAPRVCIRPAPLISRRTGPCLAVSDLRARHWLPSHRTSSARCWRKRRLTKERGLHQNKPASTSPSINTHLGAASTLPISLTTSRHHWSWASPPSPPIPTRLLDGFVSPRVTSPSLPLPVTAPRACLGPRYLRASPAVSAAHSAARPHLRVPCFDIVGSRCSFILSLSPSRALALARHWTRC